MQDMLGVVRRSYAALQQARAAAREDPATGSAALEELEKAVADLLAAGGARLQQMVAEHTAELSEINARLERELAERKLGEAALRASEEKYRDLVENINDVIFAVDDGGGITYISPVIEMLSGYRPAELIGRSFADFIHPEDLPALNASFERTKRGDLEQSEYRIVCRDGAVRWVRTYNRPILGAHETGGVRGVLRDITERTHAEAALRRSEAKNRALLDAIPDLMLTVRTDGTFVDYKAARDIEPLVPPSEFLGRKIADIMPADHTEAAMPRIERALANRQTEFLEYQLPLAGEVRDFEARYVPAGDDEVLILIRDITARKRAEDMLRRSEERYRTLAGNFPNGVVLLFDRDLRYLLVDGRGLAGVGLSKEALEGKTIWEALPTETAAELEPVYRATLAGEAMVHQLQYAGGIHELHAVPVRNERGAVVAGMVMSQNVTVRKRAEEALRESEAKFRTLAETVATAIFIFQDTRLRYVNPAAEAVTGYTRAELLSMSFWEIIHPEFREFVRERGLARQRGEPVPPRYEVKILTKDGSERWMDFSGSVFDFDGQPAVLGTAFDVTERKQGEAVAQQHQAELAHALRVSTLGEMAAGLAHELNQPLSAIVSYARGCVHRIESGSPQADLVYAIEQVAAQGLRAGEILQRYRGFLRTGTHQHEWVNLNALVEEAVRFAKAEQREREVPIRLDLAPLMPQVQIDRVQIEQVILNLIRNGLDAMVDFDGDLWVRTLVGDSAVEVAVQDAGRGIPPDVRERIFDAFFTTKPKGLGMGLSISRSIVEAHGGRLWATANAGGGTTFRFSVPVGVPALPHAR